MWQRLTLVLTGAFAGILGFTGVDMLMSRDFGGDTPSPDLAALLLAGALLVAIAGIVVAMAMPWSRWLSLVVGVGCVVLGFGGLLYFLLATLMVSGSFPNTLLTPLNLSFEALMAVAGLTGIGLLTVGSDPATTDSFGGSWRAVAVGFCIGIAAAWFWGAVVWPLIPYECCQA